MRPGDARGAGALPHPARMSDSPRSAPDGVPRRRFLSTVTSWFMLGGLLAGYGAFGAMAGRFLFPSRPRRRAWLFVARADGLRAGDSLAYRTPAGQRVAIARRAETAAVEDFVALSSTCPHLGCQVHWEPQNQRFFCPCHNGAFDPSGIATEGPPAEAGQSLPRYPLKIEAGLLYIEVPVDGIG